MWRPNDVVREHRTRATMVWIGLLLSIVGFVVWQSVALVKKYESPNTTFEVSDDVYRFPYTEVCFGGGNGCNWEGCIESVYATVYDPCYEDWNVQVESPGNSDACVTFDMERVETEAFQARNCTDETQKPTMFLQMYWIANNDTGGEDSYNSRVSVYLGGELVEAFTWVPYTRVESPEKQTTPDIRLPQTDMTIGKSTRSLLSGSSVTTYPALTTSTTYTVNQSQSDVYDDLYSKLIYLSSDSSSDSSSNFGGDPSFGFTLITLTLGSFSLTSLSDDNPLDMLDFIANIGGFWEVLLLAWGVFFIARHNDNTPKQKARNFVKAIQRGGQGGIRPVAVEGPSPSSSVAVVVSVTPSADHNGEERPNWNIVDGGPRQATSSRSSRVGGRVLANENTV